MFQQPISMGNWRKISTCFPQMVFPSNLDIAGSSGVPCMDLSKRDELGTKPWIRSLGNLASPVWMQRLVSMSSERTDRSASLLSIVTISSFLFLHCSSYASLLYWTNFAPPFMGTLRLNSASSALRRAWLFSSMDVLLLHVQFAAQLTSLLSHRPPTIYIRLSFSTENTAWSVRRVSMYLYNDTSCTFPLNLNLLYSPWIPGSL